MLRISFFLVAAALVLLSCNPVAELVAPTTVTPVPTPFPQPSVQVPATAGPSTPAASAIILKVKVADLSDDIPKYDRKQWRHWADEDGDCQDARQETLIAESTIAVTYTADDRCRVESGRWVGPYTGTEVTDPSDLDIDHMVPLANSHRSGGWSWSSEKKSSYANHLAYPGHLVASTARANRAKEAKGPEEWRPPNGDYWCQYALDWIEIKRAWDLTATEEEVNALREMTGTCESNEKKSSYANHLAYPGHLVASTARANRAKAKGPEEWRPPNGDYWCQYALDWIEIKRAWDLTATEEEVNALREMTGTCESNVFIQQEGAVSQPEPAVPTPVQTEPVPTPTGTSVTSPPTPTPAAPDTTFTPTPTTGGQSKIPAEPSFEDRNCSDFNGWSEAQEFFLAAGGPDEDPHRLDRNSDGTACESLPGAP